MIGPNILRTIYCFNFNTFILIRNAGQYKRSLKLTNLVNNYEVREMITNLGKKQNITYEEIENFRTDLIMNKKNISEVNVDYFIVSNFNRAEDLNFVEIYVNYLKNKNLQVNNSTLGCLMKLYNLAYQSKTLTEDKQKIIFNIYKEICEKHSNLDATTCEYLILGLVCTAQWKKSIELLEIIKLSTNPSNTAYSTVISKAFENDADHELGWKLLTEMVQTHKKQPKCQVYLSFLNWIQNQKDYKKQKQSLNFMLHFVSENEIIITKLVIDKLKNTLNLMNVNNDETQISFSGKCQNCGGFLERVNITDDEFIKIRAAFLDRVIIRKDIFIKTNPKELEKFEKYVDKYAPFHCIVDGLNVAYSISGKQSSSIVCSVVKYFKDLNMNILLIGRKHMHQWPRDDLSYIKKNCKIFLTDNLSQDDPFLLYAALISGSSTHIFSRDLMRSHAHLLGEDLKIIFKKWLQQHLYSLKTIKRDGKILINEPNKYMLNAHKIKETWHIPYKDVYERNPKDSYDASKYWLCIQSF